MLIQTDIIVANINKYNAITIAIINIDITINTSQLIIWYNYILYNLTSNIFMFNIVSRETMFCYKNFYYKKQKIISNNL